MFSSLFMDLFGRESLIASDNTWALLAILCGGVAFSIWLEQKYTWASRISGAICGMILALILSNLSIIPANSALYDDVVWDFCVPMGIPLLLLTCNVKKIWKETGRILILFLIGSVGTCVGALLGYVLLKDFIPEMAGVAAIMTGSYIGGSVNLVSLAGEFHVSGNIISATTVADNLMSVVYFFALIAFAGMRFFQKNYPHPHINEVKESGEADANKTQAAAFWNRKDISLKDIAINVAYTVGIVLLAKTFSGAVSGILPTGNAVLNMIKQFLGSQYVWITTLAVAVATFGEKQVKKLHGSQEIGTYFIYLFLFVIGAPASIIEIVTETPLLLVFTGIMILVNMLFCFIGGKLLHFDLEDCILASNANIGGPTTAAGMAISQGWSKLVGPVMLIGTLGYVVGTYLGMIIGSLLGA